MADKYMMAIDEGTTSTRAVIVDHAGNMVGEAQKEFTQYFPPQFSSQVQR
jgi:glycerol kinase